MNRVILILLLIPSLLHGAETNQLSQYGITWQFNSNHTVGQFVSGDYWVLAPVTITNITPHTVTSNATVGGNTVSVTRNGSMINPRVTYYDTPTNGFDSLFLGSSYAFNGYQYSDSLNVGFVTNTAPLTITTNASLISTWSRNYSGSDIRPSQHAMAVLTVVESEPAADAFRPQPYRGSKTQTNRYSNLDWSKLRTNAVVTGAPSFASVQSYFPAWQPEFNNGRGLDQYVAPYTNSPENYPAYRSENMGDALCLVNMNYTPAQKSNLVVWLVQYGIDIYGAALDGTEWVDLGGLGTGRKAPLVFASMLLNDSGMLAWANASNHFVFHEDKQMWFVTTHDTTQPYTYWAVGENLRASNSVGRIIYAQEWTGSLSNAPLQKYREVYIPDDLGKAEWGDQHDHFPFQDGRNLDAAYRDINLRALNRVIPAMRTMGAEDEWAWPATFAYHDRMFATAQTNGLPATDWEGSTLNWYSPFASNVWAAGWSEPESGAQTTTTATVGTFILR